MNLSLAAASPQNRCCSRSKAGSQKLAARSCSFRRSQLCAARARVAIDLFFAGRDRLSGQNLPDSLLCAFPETVFRDAIFKRMKADDDEPCGGLKQLGCGLEQCPDFVQLAIDVDTQRLKGSGRRMNVTCFIGGAAEATIRANCPVVVTGRPRTMALATVRDLLSSPYS